MMIPLENMKNFFSNDDTPWEHEKLKNARVGRIMVVSFLRDEENPHRVVAGQIQFMMGFKSNL